MTVRGPTQVQGGAMIRGWEQGLGSQLTFESSPSLSSGFLNFIFSFPSLRSPFPVFILFCINDAASHARKAFLASRFGKATLKKRIELH